MKASRLLFFQIRKAGDSRLQAVSICFGRWEGAGWNLITRQPLENAHRKLGEASRETEAKVCMVFLKVPDHGIIYAPWLSWLRRPTVMASFEEDIGRSRVQVSPGQYYIFFVFFHLFLSADHFNFFQSRRHGSVFFPLKVHQRHCGYK